MSLKEVDNEIGRGLIFRIKNCGDSTRKNVIGLFCYEIFLKFRIFYRLKAPVDAISKVSRLCNSKPCSSRFEILTEFEIFYFKISMIRTPMPKVKSKEIKSKIRDPPTIYFIAIGPKRIPKNGGLYVAVR